MVTLQFTLTSTMLTESGTPKYKPMSTLLEVPSVKEYNNNPEVYKSQAIRLMCFQRKTDGYFLKKNGYTQMKVRVYDKAKIEQENAARYEQIKKERGWT